MLFIIPQCSHNYVRVPYRPKVLAWVFVRYHIAPALGVRIENNTMDIAIKGKKDRVFNYDNRLRPVSDFVDHESDMLYIYTTSRPWKLTGNAWGDVRPTNAMCPVCREDLLDGDIMVVVLKCHHRGHALCFKGCIEGKCLQSQTCPLCRMQFDKKEIEKITDLISKCGLGKPH